MKAKFKMTLKGLVVSSAAVLMLAAQVSAHSFCACCADAGEWYERTLTVPADERTELNRVRFSGVANTYMTPGGEDAIKGIDTPAETYTLTQARTANRWRLTFRDAQGHSGTLTLTMPASATYFGTDQGDEQTSQAGGPLLYKEWRFSGVATGTGIFRSAATRPMRFNLILQGRGNHCMQAGDFKNWKLLVNGARADFSFYGSLATP